MAIEDDILLIGGGEEEIGSVILTLQTDTTLLELETRDEEASKGGSCLPPLLPSNVGL